MAYLEHVKSAVEVETRLFVGGLNHSGLDVLFRLEGSVQFDLESLGNCVFELQVALENVKGGPGLGDGEAMLFVGELGLELTRRVSTLVVTGDLESNVIGPGVDFNGVGGERVIFPQKVFGGLSEVLFKGIMRSNYDDFE
jgi:hypothetical protein